MNDRLDDVLDASAPAVPTITPTDARAMMLAARPAAPRPRARRAALVTGALALLMLGGAGVATASSDWLWGDGLENPDRSYTYTSPTWGQCELRYSGFDTHNPLIQGDVNRIIDEWFANTDVEAAAAPYVDGYLAQIEADRAGDPEDVRSDPRLPDLNAWLAHDQALAEALHAELRAHGYDTGAGDLAGTDAHSQLHCDAEDWGGAE